MVFRSLKTLQEPSQKLCSEYLPEIIVQRGRIFENENENESCKNDCVDEDQDIGQACAHYQRLDPANRFWQRAEREPDQVEAEGKSDEPDAGPAGRGDELVD